MKNVSAATTAYGPYVTPLPEGTAAARALRGVRCLVVLGAGGRGLLEAARQARVQHVVLVTAAGGRGGMKRARQGCARPSTSS